MPIKKSAKPAAENHYHHGDLRNSLLKKAIAHIRKVGIHNLSLRDLAREIGVSHAAPYRHFEDKHALLIALAEDGYQILLGALREAMNSSTDVSVQIQNMAWAYIQFFLLHPEHASVMFGPDLADRSQIPALENASNEVFGIAQQIIEDAQNRKQVAAGDAALITATAWSTVHGLAVLLTTKRLHKNAAKHNDPQKMTRAAMQTLLSGILVS